MKAAEAIGDTLLTRAEVQELLGLSTSGFYAAVKRGQIPRPIRVTPGNPRWLASDVRNFLDEARQAAGYGEPQ